MKNIFFLIVLFVICIKARAQNVFERNYGSCAISIGAGASKQTKDKGFVMVGGNAVYNTSHIIIDTGNVYIQKTDSSGNILWINTYGGIREEGASSVDETTDKGFIIAGSTNSYGAGLYDAYLLKTDSAGNLLWSKTYGTSGEEDIESVQQTKDGGFILAGWCNPFPYWKNIWLT